MNKIHWTISEESLYDFRKSEDLAKAMEATGLIAPEDKTRMGNYAHFLTSTRKVTWTGKARKGLQNLADFLTHWQDCEPAALWDFYMKGIPAELISEWHTAYIESQNLFDPDPAELPEDALTEEQKVEAATPGSPLT